MCYIFAMQFLRLINVWRAGAEGHLYYILYMFPWGQRNSTFAGDLQRLTPTISKHHMLHAYAWLQTQVLSLAKDGINLRCSPKALCSGCNCNPSRHSTPLLSCKGDCLA